MKDYAKIMGSRAQVVIYIFVAIVIVFALLGWNGAINKAASLMSFVVISIITTGVCQVLIQTVSGGFLEKIPLTLKIKGVTISIPLFFVVTVVLKLWLF